MDQHTREQQTDALLSAMTISGTASSEAVAMIRTEINMLRNIARSADAYRQGIHTDEMGKRLEFDFQILNGYRSAVSGPLCRSCGRPFSPSHDASDPSPTSRHPFLPVVNNPWGHNEEGS